MAIIAARHGNIIPTIVPAESPCELSYLLNLLFVGLNSILALLSSLKLSIRFVFSFNLPKEFFKLAFKEVPGKNVI